MKIGNNIGMYNTYNMFNTLYQGNMLSHSNRLNRNFFPLPGNKAQGTGALGSGAVQFINSIKSSSKALSGTIKELSGPAFSNRAITSSNNDVMTVSYSGNKPGSVTSMNIRIDQTAEGQLNEGTIEAANAAYQGAVGVNKFSVEIGGKTTEISVNVAEGDTNKNVQQKMADAINKAGLGIKATVATDSKTSTSMLSVESTKTGADEKNSFKITDITGDMAAKTGIDKVTREGRDAEYSVNGGPARTSQSNSVYLGNGVTATFLKASEETVTVSRGQDMKYAISQVESLVKSYNDLYVESVQRTNDMKSQNLASKMVSITGTYSNALSSVGIGFDSSGRMTLDSEKLGKAAESGRLEQFFTQNSGRNYGFTNQLSRLADNVQRNTSNYVGGSIFGSGLSENFSYSSFGDLIQYNFLSAGSILDFML